MAALETSMQGGAGPFPATSWSLISDCREADSPEQRERLDDLMRRYWAPVYFFVRRNWGKEVEEAKDLTQAFFCAFTEKEFLQSVSAERGRFRNFVCAALTNFLRQERRAALARRRRPPEGLRSLEAIQPVEPPVATGADPAEQFDEDWKRALVAAALERLGREADAAGKGQLVALLEQYDLAPDPERKPTYESLAEAAGMTTSQVTNGLHWARKQLRAHFLKEIRDQVASYADYREEARALFGIDVGPGSEG